VIDPFLARRRSVHDHDLTDLVRGCHQARQTLELQLDHLEELARRLIKDMKHETHQR
jgi:hypothetical protein